MTSTNSAVDREAVARAILDGWYEGDVEWSAAPEQCQHRAFLAADALLSRLRATPSAEAKNAERRDAVRVMLMHAVITLSSFSKLNEHSLAMEASINDTKSSMTFPMLESLCAEYDVPYLLDRSPAIRALDLTPLPADKP